MNTLTKIVSYKKLLVSEQKQLYPIKLLEKSVYFETPSVSLKQYILRKDKSGIIAEIKKKSPSKGIINNFCNIQETSIGYMQAGASAISVLTDQAFFGGSNTDLVTARKHNFCPILRKDFIVDEYQIIEAKSIGADAILLIAAILTREEVKQFTKLANDLGLEVLLEIHSIEEIDKIGEFNNIIGVNNRDLRTLKIDLNNSYQLRSHISSAEVKVAESGIEDPDTIIELRSVGYNGFLIGSHFMKHSRPHVACKNFINQLNSKTTQHA